MRNIAVPADKALRDTTTELFGFIEERLAGTEDIRSSGAVDFVLCGLYRIHYRILGQWRRTGVLHITIRLLAGVVTSIGFGIAFVAGYHLHRSGVLTLGAVYLIIHWTQLIARPIRIITQQFESLQTIGANVQRVYDLLAARPLIAGPVASGAAEAAPPVVGARHEVALQFDGVTFGYNPAEPVVRAVDFCVKPGEVLGVLGRTGSGKTTLARLVFRLYDPAVFLTPPQAAYTAQVARLFSDTLRSNILLGLERTDDEIHAAIRGAVMDRDVNELEGGLDTKVGPKGVKLSGGQMQRAAAARMLVRDAELMVFDDLSSALDVETERELWDRFFLRAGATCIAVSHRRTVLTRADQVIVLRDRNLVGQGRLTDLLASCEEMRGLWHGDSPAASLPPQSSLGTGG